MRTLGKRTGRCKPEAAGVDDGLRGDVLPVEQDPGGFRIDPRPGFEKHDLDDRVAGDARVRKR